jgi:acyl transferase domain-containing protein
MNDNDIAIIGMAARVPGARTASEFWTNLVSGVESIELVSREDLLAAGESPEKLARPNYVRATAPLGSMEHFDAEFFGFSPKEAAILDPQHRHFFECAWEALEDAGHTPERFKGPIGVFAGAGMGSYFYFNLCSNPQLVESVGMFLLRHTGNDKDFLSTRLSFLLDLRGPSVNVQTACSTSLVAVHLACQSLLSGECDMALAGGVTIDLPHRRGYLYHENEILSPDGHCHAFDARAQGTVLGSGTGIVVLRRLKDALESNDNIVAVIRGSAVNTDGASKAGYLAPSVDGQAAAVSESLARAGVSADTIGYVECHGTGTYFGDPIEISALTLAHRRSTDKKQYCRIGSVKSNIGHLDTAAGVVSLIKASMAVREGLIPPSLNFDKPNPSIDFESSPFLVNAKLHRWQPSGVPRRAAVNSLGVGGTNAHVVVEEPPAREAPPPGARYQLIQLSARNRPALDAISDRLADHLEKHPEQELADVCFTLREGRRAFSQRRVLAAGSRTEAIELLRSKDPRRLFNHAAAATPPEVIFMFPGGGVQYANMALGLYAAEEVFRRWVDQGFDHLRGKVDFDPGQVLFPNAGGADESATARSEELLRRPGVQLPLLFIVEYALAQLLMAKGLQPKALIGHSMGENTAACLAGVMSFGDALGLVALRGKLFDTVPTGGMLSVAMTEAALRAELGGELDLACVNAPELCVASGPKDALGQLQQKLEAKGVEVNPIPIDIAAHSRMLEPILAEFGAYLRGIRLSAPQIPFISNRSGTWITDQEATDPQYWVGHLRHTVQFFQGIDELTREASRLLLEIGPGNVLGSLAKQHPKANPQAIISTLRHTKETTDDVAFFLAVMGRLWGAGRALDTEQLFPDQPSRRRVSLPTYAFQRERYWIDPGAGAVADKSATLEPARVAELERWFYRSV